MILRHGLSSFLVVMLMVMSICTSHAREVQDLRHVEVTLRMAGHKILQNAGDSTSRVLPVERAGDQFRLRFENDFEFLPDELMVTVNEVIKEAGIANRYIIEVESCDSSAVVYSYEFDSAAEYELNACMGRGMEPACYTILVTFMNPDGTPLYPDEEASRAALDSGVAYTVIIILLGLMIATFIVLRRKRKSLAADYLVSLGAFKFDTRTTELILADERIELTGKEADLLSLLHESANSTVERDVILNRVWGDEGDYVGRTLDVFISKLRKKLEADSTLRIVNIRGVGYKLVVGG